MTLTEFAKFFGIAPATAQRVVRMQEALPAERRTLRTIRLGKRVAIVRADAMALAANGGVVETQVAS
jgi:hypothetical protein